MAETLTYDGAGRVVDASHPDGLVHHVYDALGRRVSKTVNGTVTKYVYDGVRVIAEYDGAGQLLRKYIYGPGLDEPVLMQVGATRYYYLFDSLGSVVGLTDASGGLAEAYRYSPYGQPLQASTVGNPYLFTGREFDSETGLHYYRARYYSPQLRRFIEPDPIGFEGGMNLYAYVGNDPANAVDPWGLDGKAAAAWAHSQIGSTDYQWVDEHKESHGKWVSRLGGRGAFKCNAFVWDALGAGGDPPGRVTGNRIPLATEWANANFTINGYTVLKPGTPLLRGDVVAFDGHVGIYYPLEDGSPATISAQGIFRFGLDSVVNNDWGFREDQTPTIRRCDCGRPKYVGRKMRKLY